MSLRNWLFNAIVTRDMVRKLGELQKVHNELRFNVETVLPCTNLLKFSCDAVMGRYWTVASYQKFIVFAAHKSA